MIAAPGPAADGGRTGRPSQLKRRCRSAVPGLHAAVTSVPKIACRPSGADCSAAGDGIQQALEQALLPLLEKYHVQAYLAGHEHDLQVIRRPGGTVTHLVSGAGSETRPLGVPDPKDGRLFAVASAGFMAMSLTAQALNVELVDAENRVPYAISLKP